jgi:hypothetical protein
MKFIFLALLSLSLVACSTVREPSSVQSEAEKDVSYGINAEYYGTR